VGFDLVESSSVGRSSNAPTPFKNFHRPTHATGSMQCPTFPGLSGRGNFQLPEIINWESRGRLAHKSPSLAQMVEDCTSKMKWS
jgi:hypothetical protein